MPVSPDWWKDFFHGVAVDMWLAVATPEMNRDEADFLEKTLQLKPGAKVLDVPCGGGRHAVELAARGYHVTGVDYSTELLAHARKQPAPVDWQQCDMRELPWQGEFDAAYCWGNSFPYFDDAGNAAFVASVARALKPGGRFALETGAAAESILPNFQERRWYLVGDIHFLVHNRYDHAEGFLEPELTFIRNGAVEVRGHRQRVYSHRELCGLLTTAGFGAVDGYGGLHGEAYGLGAQRLVLVASKPLEA
jgi:SAM-dependent methyltransferase